MAIKLYRCKNVWVKSPATRAGACRRPSTTRASSTSSSKGPGRRGKRGDLEKLSGQTKYPVIQFEDGSVYREESKDMAETIITGKLFDKQGAQQPSA